MARTKKGSQQARARRNQQNRENGGGGGPPPPRSPPRRPPSPRRDDRYRDDRYRDEYDRPPRQMANWAPINGHTERFGSGDSYRPGPSDRDRDRDRGYDRYGGGESHRSGLGGSDSWRPPPPPPQQHDYRPPQSDFTFRSNGPVGAPNFPPAPTQPRNFSGGRGDRRGNSTRGRGRGRGGRPPPVHLSERTLLTNSVRNLPEEQLHDGGDGNAKFRNLDELSDDAEEPMEIESNASQSDAEQPSKKRARTDDTAGQDANAAPKWSNPDPYTALPCPDEQQQKKRDVVALIRKARNDAANAKAPDEAEDFIAFSSSESEREDEEDDVQEIPPPPPVNAPRGPAPKGRPPPSAPIAPSVPDQRDSSGPLGSRKRTADDVIKPPNYGQLKKVSMKKVDGAVTGMWSPKLDEDPCPWATVDHSGTTNVAFRLHKEVMDFYQFVRPRDFEQRIRENLVDNLKKAMRRDNRNFADAEVHAFGSFMSGLYLPTADMDLVVCSSSFMKRHLPKYSMAKSWLYKFSKLLQAQRIADQESIEVISGARIPLVKFVDRATGLKVDVSFENMGGVEAIDKFLQWRDQYPAMPILVTVIKHFLLMRGLNEPVNGGIGGFSVICLVVSMLQLMPAVQSRSLDPEHHLGEMLMEFFLLYGKEFNYQANAIATSGKIGYLRKTDVRGFTYKNKDRLSIIDPNNPSNDISGGSANTPAIMARFEEAFNKLNKRMRAVGSGSVKGNILEVILAGDYSSFGSQRNYIRWVHEQNIGPCHD